MEVSFTVVSYTISFLEAPAKAHPEHGPTVPPSEETVQRGMERILHCAVRHVFWRMHVRLAQQAVGAGDAWRRLTVFCAHHFWGCNEVGQGAA